MTKQNKPTIEDVELIKSKNVRWFHKCSNCDRKNELTTNITGKAEKVSVTTSYTCKCGIQHEIILNDSKEFTEKLNILLNKIKEIHPNGI